MIDILHKVEMWKSTWILFYAPPLPRAMTTKGTSTWDLCIRFWNIHKKSENFWHEAELEADQLLIVKEKKI